MLNRVLKSLTSLRLTVGCLAFATVLVLIGTIAQVHEGLYAAQERYFKSWFIWKPILFGYELPLLLPGGYLLGTVLLANLIAAHVTRFELSKKKAGIFLIHAGLILLLLGQLLTDALSVESAMRLTEGEAKNYSEDFHANELVLIDTTRAESDQVTSIPETVLRKQKHIDVAGTPLTVRVRQYWPNSELSSKPVEGAIVAGATAGIGQGVYVLGRPTTTKMNERNIPSAVVEVASGTHSLGTWLVSSQLARKQSFTHGDRTYDLALRFTRHYKPFSLELVDFRHDKYKGTETPKNFSSRVRLHNAASGEDREVLIYMNNPLRYQGETYYQASFDPRDERVTILQVVRNPSWLTPYLACVIVSIGLIVQFGYHLVGFALKRRSA